MGIHEARILPQLKGFSPPHYAPICSLSAPKRRPALAALGMTAAEKPGNNEEQGSGAGRRCFPLRRARGRLLKARHSHPHRVCLVLQTLSGIRIFLTIVDSGLISYLLGPLNLPSKDLGYQWSPNPVACPGPFVRAPCHSAWAGVPVAVQTVIMEG